MATALTDLERKGSDVVTIDRSATVFDAAKKMNDHRIGALVVISGDKAVGIFTERDILNRVVAEELDPRTLQVEKVMTSPMACCRRDTTLDDCKAMMTSQRARHLPVVEEGKLYGMVSSGDIVALESENKQATIEYLHEYLYGLR